MTQPPAFQFYPDDFIGGTVDMLAKEVGHYIRLIAYQWSHGQIPTDPNKLKLICGGKVSQNVLRKFPNGRNIRLEKEREKQTAFRTERSKSGSSGARKRWHSHSTANSTATVLPMANDSSPSPSPSSKRTESADRPSREEITAAAQMVGLAEWKALDWFNEMQAGGWLDYNHRPIVDWRAAMARVRTKWESDGRPNSPPKPYHAKNNSNPPGRVDRNQGTANANTNLADKYSRVRALKAQADQSAGGGVGDQGVVVPP